MSQLPIGQNISTAATCINMKPQGKRVQEEVARDIKICVSRYGAETNTWIISLNEDHIGLVTV